MKLENKVILIGDPHFGIKKFSNKVFDVQIKFFKEQVIPYMKENNIKTLISMGDLFDHRVIMDIAFFDRFVSEFIKLLKDNGIEFINIVGNHDLYFKNRLDVSLVKHLPYFYDSIKIIDKVTNINNMTLVPWIVSDNELPNEYNEIVLGHFEFANIDKMISGKYDYKHFNKAKMVLSGHYHNFSKKDNVTYLGTPYQLTWNDFNEIKGFYELDIDKVEMKFIENEISPKHIKIIYNKKYQKLLIKGFKEDLFLSVDDTINKLKNHRLKFIIETDGDYEEIIYKLKKELDFEVINEAKIIEISNINLDEDKKIETAENILEDIPDKYKDIMHEVINFKIE